jgi:hypothetical protein
MLLELELARPRLELGIITHPSIANIQTSILQIRISQDCPLPASEQSCPNQM